MPYDSRDEALDTLRQEVATLKDQLSRADIDAVEANRRIWELREELREERMSRALEGSTTNLRRDLETVEQRLSDTIEANWKLRDEVWRLSNENSRVNPMVELLTRAIKGTLLMGELKGLPADLRQLVFSQALSR